MAITFEHVREIFKGLATGNGSAFFEHVAENVDWTVMGTHPLSGHYPSKQAFLQGTFAKLKKVLPQGVQLTVEHILLAEDSAAVELRSVATAKNGMRLDIRDCWIVYFQGDSIVRARLYLDSALVTRLFEENPIQEATVGGS